MSKSNLQRAISWDFIVINLESFCIISFIHFALRVCILCYNDTYEYEYND